MGETKYYFAKVEPNDGVEGLSSGRMFALQEAISWAKRRKLERTTAVRISISNDKGDTLLTDSELDEFLSSRRLSNLAWNTFAASFLLTLLVRGFDLPPPLFGFCFGLSALALLGGVIPSAQLVVIGNKASQRDRKGN
jgi:hypothetical protein